MSRRTQIKHFVRETLGCTCPDEVFEHIDVEHHAPRDDMSRIVIGQRLLIYLLDVQTHKGLGGGVEEALRLGVEERGRSGYNRFRLVLVTPDIAAVEQSVRPVFEHSPLFDEKTHLHVVSEAVPP